VLIHILGSEFVDFIAEIGYRALARRACAGPLAALLELQVEQCYPLADGRGVLSKDLGTRFAACLAPRQP
jgi:hypothetical protein